MDRKTRNIMTMNRMYHPQSDKKDCTFQKWKVDGRLLSIANLVETEEQNLSPYLDQSEKRLLRERVRGFCQNMKDLHLPLRNRKREKNTVNGKRNSSMVNL